MRYAIKDRSHSRIVFTVLLMAAGLVSGLGTKKAMAADKLYLDIGMNDWVSIYEDIDHFYGYIRFCPKKNGAITFSVTGDEKLIAPAKLMKRNGSGDYVGFTPSYDYDFMENHNEAGGKTMVTYGVKKGVHYALRVEMDGSYWVNSSFKSVKDTGGKKKSSAKTIKKGKTQYGMIPMTGKKQSRWYKFKVPQTKKVTVDFKGWGNSALYYQIMVKGKATLSRQIYNNNWDYNPGENDMAENTKTKKMTATLKKGTVVYLRVYSKYKNDSGYYSWKWK